jgi:prevent-host-death family protein
MIRVGVSELRDQISALLQRVLEDGETIEVTVEGKTVARVVPTQTSNHAPDTQVPTLEELIAEIEAKRKDNVGAVETVREIRREL